MDNYSESATYPVLLHSTKKEVHNSVDMGDRDEEEDYGGDDGEGEVVGQIFVKGNGASSPEDGKPGGVTATVMEVPLLQVRRCKYTIPKTSLHLQWYLVS